MAKLRTATRDPLLDLLDADDGHLLADALFEDAAGLELRVIKATLRHAAARGARTRVRSWGFFLEPIQDELDRDRTQVAHGINRRPRPASTGTPVTRPTHVAVPLKAGMDLPLRRSGPKAPI